MTFLCGYFKSWQEINEKSATKWYINWKIYIFKGEVKILGNQENQDIFQFVKRNIFSLNYKSAMAKQVLSKLFSLYNFQYGYVNHHVLINWLLLINEIKIFSWKEKALEV